MIEIIIDGKDLYTKQQAHEFFSAQEGFPEKYGKNLDALFDVLTSLPEIKVKVKNPRNIVDHLGEYGKKLLLVIKDACDRNPGIVLEVEEEEETCGCDECDCEDCDCEECEDCDCEECDCEECDCDECGCDECDGE